LLPLGGEATPKLAAVIWQTKRISRARDCCAAERDDAAFRQAPSPPGFWQDN